MPAEHTDFTADATDSPAGQGGDSMMEMLDRYTACRRIERGQILCGVVVHASPTEIIVDIGAKCEGIVPERDLQHVSPDILDAIQVNDEVMVYVIDAGDASGSIMLSLSRAQRARDWLTAQKLLESRDVVESQVVDCNKGGVIVHIGDLRGFVPGSQLDRSHLAGAPDARADGEERWKSVVGKTLQLKVIEVDQERNRLILSERAALRDHHQEQLEKILNELSQGDVRRGRVTNLTDFGAFVDIGGMDGLVHLSELSWERVSHPSELLDVGQEIDVYVMRVDKERQRVALSLKRLQPDPWASIEERYEEGLLVEGVITRLTKWGAFASIVGDEAIEGLIHISELDDGPVVHPRDVVQPDQVVTLRVIGLDAERHRLSLSLKQASQGEYTGRDWKAMLSAEQPEPEGRLSAALAEAMAKESSENKGERIGN